MLETLCSGIHVAMQNESLAVPILQNVPRSYGSVSICEIFVEDFLTFVIMLDLPPVVLAQTPCSVLVAVSYTHLEE